MVKEITLHTPKSQEETTTFLHSFWQRLIDRARTTGKGHLAKRPPSNDWWLYSDAGVPHFECDGIGVRLAHGDDDRSPGFGELDGIRQQIEQDLFDLLAIRVHRAKILR